MKIYHICGFCDKVFSVSICDEEKEGMHQLLGVCPECSEELAWQHDALIFKVYEH
ncbi:hypothetical protein SAMN02745221_00198 [Thermosyntropha lipolytica DSM 11003]|uniref:CPXCG motif-containing cysteine-rich protein n=1 Tax=Thermosyntropha lipolytica DSM 11003 TaxID=1123382 RepID=A0A1M5JS87_9FIRM|nr:hypothetical protein [Thermosyntropha lipolytica]SHG43139.1 hypothetical protein SAMN02745221_00198 [Thermosyntropha lipolytica DSM 11003]